LFIICLIYRVDLMEEEEQDGKKCPHSNRSND
jgi:hypothetical protein